ncbi:MAG TPA: TRAP transporter small permease subunit, partial [Steroidobacteraceae bacterium]|nr:TRAP transporter small permease subunit [Steroidobacteraceae bacterium]
MNSDASLADDTLDEDEPEVRNAPPSGRSPEEWFVVAALVVMVVLPLANIVLRSIFHVGLWNEGTLVQHLTLFVGMAGSALAARNGRLLTLATGSWLPASWAAPSRWFSQMVAATIAGSLALASAQFAAAEREAGQMLVPGVPLWIVLGVLPLGFAAITLRLLSQASPAWPARLLAFATAAGVVAASAWLP